MVEKGKDLLEAHGGIFGLTIDKEHDTVRPKEGRSIILGSDIKYSFNEAAIKRTLVAGFHLDLCVLESVLDLIEGGRGLKNSTKVALLTDCCEASGLSPARVEENAEEAYAKLVEANAICTTSTDVLEFLHAT